MESGERVLWFPVLCSTQTAVIFRRSSQCSRPGKLATVNPTQGRGGGGTLCPPPPQVNFLKYLKNALSYRVETFWLLKWTNFQKKNLVFNCLRPSLVTIATPKVDGCFRTTYFNSFHAKSPQNSKVFCCIYYWYEGWTKWNPLWRFGLNIPLDGVLVTVFVSHSFSCFIDLKMNTTSTMASPMVSFDLVFQRLSEKVTFSYFY